MAKTVRKIWEIVVRFKRRCRSKGWRVIEREDIIKRNEEFHKILWTRNIRSSTFKSVATDKKIAIQEGVSYRPIDVSYNAWICATPISDSVKQAIARKPELLNRNAVYDLSKISTKKVVGRLNKTGSSVFQEFESFLKDELQFELKPIKTQAQEYKPVHFAQ